MHGRASSGAAWAVKSMTVNCLQRAVLLRELGLESSQVLRVAARIWKRRNLAFLFSRLQSSARQLPDNPLRFLFRQGCAAPKRVVQGSGNRQLFASVFASVSSATHSLASIVTRASKIFLQWRSSAKSSAWVPSDGAAVRISQPFLESIGHRYVCDGAHGRIGGVTARVVL